MLPYLAYLNFSLAAFNLLPGFPLDGGRVLRAYLWHRSGHLGQATRTASRVGGIFAMILMGMGFLSILTVSLIPGVWLILIGLMLKNAADSEYRSFELPSGLHDMKLRQVMAPPIAVDPSMTFSHLVDAYV